MCACSSRTREDQEEVKIHRGSPSLLLALVKAYGFTFFVAGFFKIGHDLLAFGGPLLLRYFTLSFMIYCKLGNNFHC